MTTVSRAAYLMLDYVVDSSLPVYWPFLDDIGEILNKPHPHTGPGMLRSEMIRLLKDGLIEVVDAGGNRLNVDPIDQMREIDRQKVPTKDLLSYRLTLLGGRLWEEYSSPRWNEYLEGSEWEERSEARSPSRAALKKYLQWDWIVSGCRPIEGTIEWQEVRPWKATYWKTLESGIMLTYRHEKIPEPPRHEWPPEVEAWYQKRYEWYTRPAFADDLRKRKQAE